MASHRALTHDHCLMVARRFFGCHDVKVVKWAERKLSEKPAGFLGAHKIVEVTAACNDRTASIPVFVKTLPANARQVALIHATGAFKKEMLFYQEMVTAWERRGIISTKSVLERESDIDEVSWNCRLYLATEDIVILENIGVIGFRSDSPRNPYDFEHALMAVKMLASFHAACLVYEDQMSAELGRPYRVGFEFPDMVQDTFYLIKEGHPGETTTETGIYALVECAKLLPVCENMEKRKLVEQRLPGLLREVFEWVKPSKRFRNVLCHSDLWQNNILFRYSEDGRPIDVKLVDFQLLRYAPPAHDIWTLLYLTTRRALRDTRGEELLQGYYEALKVAARRRGADARRLLPPGEFRDALREQRFSGRLASVYALHFLLSSDEALGKYWSGRRERGCGKERPVFSDPQKYDLTLATKEGRADLVTSQFKSDAKYREHLEECLMELLEYHVFV